ncbi:DUF3667 domain-containing protein [bacterium]|nr:DUF3667 domain-containing protein [bacterium]
MPRPRSLPPEPPAELTVTVHHRVRRLDWSLVRDAVLGSFNLDRGYLHTAWSFARRPAATFQDYLGAGRVHHVNPLRLMVLLAAVAAFMSFHSGASEGVVEGFAAGKEAGPELAAEQSELREFMNRNFNLVILGSVPLMAWITRLVYWRRPYNWLEHVALNAFLYVVTTLAYLVVLAIAFLWPLALDLYGPPVMVYQVWVYRRVLGGSWWPAILATVLGTLGVLATTSVVAAAVLLT